MILTKHEETKKGRLFHENEKLRIFVSSCSINYLYQVIFLSSLYSSNSCVPSVASERLRVGDQRSGIQRSSALFKLKGGKLEL